MFEVSGKGAGVSRGYAIVVSGNVLENNTTIGGFSVLESIARKQVDVGAMGLPSGTGDDDVVLIPQLKTS